MARSVTDALTGAGPQVPNLHEPDGRLHDVSDGALRLLARTAPRRGSVR